MTNFKSISNTANSEYYKLDSHLRFIYLKICLLICLFAYLFICLLPEQVRAQASRSFTISPPSLAFTLEPGEKTEKIIKITNNSTEPLEFVANTVDFIVKDKAGTPELLPVGQIETKYAASSWSMVSPDTIIIPAGKTSTTTLYVQVPGNARPGGRYFAVTFRPLNSVGRKNTGASVNSVVGSLVYLTVAGDAKEEAEIVDFSAPKLSEYGPIAINTEIKNLGDAHISPKAVVEVKNIFGKKVFSTALANLNIFPGASRIFDNSWEKKFLFGYYKANLDGYFGQANNLPLTAMTFFWVIPYKLVAILVLAMLIVIIAVRYVKKSQPKELPETDTKSEIKK